MSPPTGTTAGSADVGGSHDGASHDGAAEGTGGAVPAVLDLRLVGPAAGVWLTTLVLLGAPATTAYVTTVTALTAALLLAIRATRPPGGGGRVGVRGARAGAAVLVCVAASALGVGVRLSAVESGPVRAFAAREAVVRLGAVVTGDPRAHMKEGAARHRETMLVPVRVEEIDRCRVRVPVLVLATDPGWKRVLPSQRIAVTARLTTPRRGELLAAVALVRGPPDLLGRPSLTQRVADTVRTRLREATSGLPSDQRGVLPGLVDGDTSLLTPDLADAFEKAGLTHLMAVSGENLSLLLGAVLGLGRLLGLGRRAGPLLAGATIISFVIVARPSPSVLRAAVMGAVAVVALVGGRERQGVPALCTAVLLLVLIDPELARSPGFALSVLATAGILVLAPTWRDRLTTRLSNRAGTPLTGPRSRLGGPLRRLAGFAGDRRRARRPRWLAECLAVTTAAQVACTPVLVMLGAGVNLVAIPANLLAAPAVGPATLLGVLVTVVAPASLPVAHVIALPAGLAVGWITGVARFCARVPYAVIGWPAGLAGMALMLAVFGAGLAVLRRPRLRGLAAAALAGITVTVVGIRMLAPGWPPRGWLFVTCDVGQGDGLALFAGPGRAVVVDAGPDPRPIDRCLRDLGVGVVPLLVLTHPHADHIDGVPGVLRGRSVGTVVLSPASEGEERRLLTGRAIRAAGVGDVWTIGPLTLTVIGPLGGGHVSTRDPGSTVNNASVVLSARWSGLSALLCGDVEAEAQRELLAAGVPTADVLKIPHHGSSDQDPAFLAAVHARIAIASVGAGNDYGHPAPQTMSELARLGDRTYRTDQDGDVAVVRSRGGPVVVTRR